MTIPKNIIVIDRRWFDKQWGNTYHTTEVLIDGVTVSHSQMEYGYGNTYQQTAEVGARACGDLPIPNGVTLANWCKANGVTLTHIAVDVYRKKDL